MSMDLLKHISDNVQWCDLPSDFRAKLKNDPKEYSAHVFNHSLKNQLRFNGNLVQKVVKREKQYYEKLINYSRQQCLLYPYHLQDKICKGLGIPPFLYYRDMLIYTVRREKSYDSLPNFTAADCLRLLGIGRNEYIEIVNTYKSFLTTAGQDTHDLFEILYDILPGGPLLNINFEPWYRARISSVMVDDVNASTEAERCLIDQLVDADSRQRKSETAQGSSGVELRDIDNLDVFKSLYFRGLVYLDVPVSGDDRICIPTLEGFVMNRINGDSQENLLYKIFVSVDENTTMIELADCLQVDLDLIKQAASVFCRLGFAYKKFSSKSNGSTVHHSDPATTHSAVLQNNSSIEALSPSTELKTKKRLAFIFDSKVTAYLMVGNLSSGLKPHAVTMFEVGKLSDDSLDSFLNELDNLSTVEEGEAKVYYEHAINLRQVVRFLCSQAHLNTSNFVAVDLLRGGSLLNLEPDTRIRILQKNYSVIVSLSPTTYEDKLATSVMWPTHIGPPVPEANSPWFRFFVSYLASSTDSCLQSSHFVPPVMMLVRGTRISRLPICFDCCSCFSLTTWGHDPTTVETNGLLTVLNDTLQSSPVFVQSINVFHSGSVVGIRYIPLPISSTLSAAADDQRPQFLNNLMKHMDLTYLCGYITLLAPCTATTTEVFSECNKLNGEFSDSRLTSEDRNGEIVLSDNAIILSDTELLEFVSNDEPLYFVTLHLGVPLFNSALSEAVCERLACHSSLLGTEGCKNLASINRQLVDALYKFIYQSCKAIWPLTLEDNNSGIFMSEKVTDEPVESWPMPTKSLYCVNGDLLDVS